MLLALVLVSIVLVALYLPQANSQVEEQLVRIPIEDNENPFR